VINFLDRLVMLLSTDWFKPYWGMIGIRLDESKKGLIQEGCRKIVSQILSAATEYWLTDFSNERHEETRATFESLSRASGVEKSVIEAMKDWSEMSDEDMKAGWLFEILTEDLLSDDAEGIDPLLSSDLKTIMATTREQQSSADVNFTKLSTSSKSSWDQYITQLTPDLPTSLPDMLFTFLKARRFKTFWTSIVDKLTKEQREELRAWYRRAAKSRAQRDIAPSYFLGPSSRLT
jgi:hypothetical protein